MTVEQAVKEKDLGNEAYKKKDFATAHQHYDKAIALDPANIVFYNNKAAAYFEETKYEECIEMCHKAAEIGREHRADYKQIAKTLARIGNSYMKKEDAQQALHWFKKSLSEHRDPEIVKKQKELEIMSKVEPKYVIVAKNLEDDADRIELPTEQDNTLGLQTLIKAFPGANGLKYKNPNIGTFRALSVDNAGVRFYPPADGWADKVFMVIPQQQLSTSVAVGSKRKRMDDEEPIDVEGNTVKRCRRFMLYFCLAKSGDGFIDGSVRQCATICNTKFALTAGHCIPDGLPSDYRFNLYDDDENSYPVNAVKVHKPGEGGNDDYSVLKLIEGEFPNVPKGLASPYDGERYFVLGYDAEYPSVPHLSCFTGRFRNTKIYQDASYVIGSPGTTDGCSGGGVFDKWGHLFGICVWGKLDSTKKNMTLVEHINEATLKSSQPSYSHIVPAHYIMGVMNEIKSLN